MNVLIVSRHAGAVGWLRRRGIEGEVVAHVEDVAEVHGKVVFGALPMYLAAAAEAVVSIDMPGLTLAQRGQDLTPAEMDAAGAVMRAYIVHPYGWDGCKGGCYQTRQWLIAHGVFI